MQRKPTRHRAVCAKCATEFFHFPSDHQRFCSPGCGYASRRFLTASLEDRFATKVAKGPGCWGWTGGRTRFGHGVIRLPHKGPLIYAHRLSWELAYGPIPDGLHVCHHCDNPPCVRPDHLFLGTQLDNMLDMFAKGRRPSPRGKPQRRKPHP